MHKLSEKDFTSVLINVMYVKLLLAYPRKMIIIAGNASWLLSIYITLVMLLLFFLITKAYDFSKKLLEAANDSFGKVFKMLIGIISILMLMLSMMSIIRIYPETVKIILLQRTPIEVTLIFLGIAVVIGAYAGIEAVGRITSLFLPIATIIMLGCLIMLFPHIKVSNLTPILGKGAKSIFVDGLSSLSAFSDIFILFFLSIERRDKIKVCGYKSIIVMGTIMTLILLFYNLIFPANIAENFLMPLYQLTRIIQIGDFFGRFEAFFEFIWTISVLLYYSIYLYVIAMLWKDIFGMKHYKPLIIPFMILIIVMAMNPDSYTEIIKGYGWYTIVLISVSILVPIIVGIIGKIKQKKE